MRGAVRGDEANLTDCIRVYKYELHHFPRLRLEPEVTASPTAP